MTAPPHAAEHHELLQIIGKLVNKSILIEGAVLITIGVDGRPCVGGNVGDTAQIIEIMRQLVEAGDQAGEATQVKVPRDN